MGSVPTSLGEWIHSPWFDLGLVVWKGYRPRVRLVLAGVHASAWISPFWRGPAPGAQRYQAARPFRLIIQTIHITATLGGFLDRRTMRQAAESVVEVAFLLLRTGVPPNLHIWTTIATGTNSTVQRLRPNTLLADVARMVAPAIRFNLLVQDQPTAATRSPGRELSAPGSRPPVTKREMTGEY